MATKAARQVRQHQRTPDRETHLDNDEQRHTAYITLALQDDHPLQILVSVLSH